MKNRRFGISLLFVVLMLSLILTGCGQDDIPSEFEFDRLRESSAEPLIIGQVPSRSVIELLEKRKALLRLLSRTLDRNFELRVADTYDGIIRGMEREQYDLAVLGPLAYVKAVDELNAPYRPLVRPVRFGHPYYRSMIITNPQSDIDSLSDLRGQSMAFVDPTSTSGYLFPRAHIIQNAGFDPFEAASRTSFLGGHDRVVEAVHSGAYDAGAVFDDARRLVLDGNLNQKLPVVDRTRPIPSEPISVRTDLSDETIQKLRKFFLTLHEDHPGVLNSLGSNIDRYVEADDADYDEVRTVKRVLEDVPRP